MSRRCRPAGWASVSTSSRREAVTGAVKGGCGQKALFALAHRPLFALAHSVNRCTDELVMRTEHCTSIEPWSESEIVRHHQNEMGMEACRV